MESGRISIERRNLTYDIVANIQLRQIVGRPEPRATSARTVNEEVKRLSNSSCSLVASDNHRRAITHSFRINKTARPTGVHMDFVHCTTRVNKYI